MSFVHLHAHTEFSIRDATNKIADYVARVKELGMNACAITDHGVMYGAIQFYKACTAAGIKPVIGCEVYVAPGSRLEKKPHEDESRYYHLILLAENNEGYHNLCRIVSQGFIDGFYYKPRVDLETLRQYHSGIICLSACLAGQVARNLANGNYDAAKETALLYRDIFGADNYFLELQDHGIADQKTVNQGILRLHQETGIPMVVTNDCHYTRESDAPAHDILLCMQGNHLITDTDRRRYEGTQFYVKSEEEMRALFPYALEAVDNTQKIADRCNVTITFGKHFLPHYDVPAGYTSTEYLTKLCNDGLLRRYGDRAEEYRPRLEYELSVIENMGFVDYFLIVWDFINYARTHGIAIGPGRGSAAGSIVSYTTGITDIDPIRFNLVFERFLNAERVTMPDIDVDIQHNRRSEVIAYVNRKYGADCVSQIITFGTLAARNAIRSVGRVLGMPYSAVDVVAKAVPQVLGITIDKALEMNPELKRMYDSDPKVRELVDEAKKLEGLPSNAGMHAAGVVISERPVVDMVPVSRNEADGPLVTQYQKEEVEEVGLLKMDFLGLRNLTVIQDTAAMVRQQIDPHFDIEEISYEDPKVFATIGSGHTDGIFQLESSGMESFMKQLEPQSLEDVTAGISLYRPGPMQFIPNYLAGKANRDSIHYDCPELEPILAPTYGCIVYQEQVMQIVRDLAGYSMGRADLVRRAMSKKKADVMAKERQNFVYGNPEEHVPGCVAKGIAPDVANHIFDEMTDFASYAFNKSHAAAYAVVAYQTAYLKTYYPAQFMAAMMTSFVDAPAKVTSYINASKEMGISVLAPDINTGHGEFSVEDGSIRFGMYGIKSVGNAAVDAIVAEREKNGPFHTLHEFIRRMGDAESGLVNRRAVENLIHAGALDCLPGNRRQKILAYPGIVDAYTAEKKAEEKNRMAGQLTLFDILPEDEKAKHTAEKRKAETGSLPEAEEFTKQELLAQEKEVLGIYVSGHPLDDYREMMQRIVTAHAADFSSDGEEEENGGTLRDQSRVTIGGTVTASKITTTKKGSLMAFITVEDMTGSVECIVFASVLEQHRHLVDVDSRVYIYGRVSADGEQDAKLIAEEMCGFDELPLEAWVRFPSKDAYDRNSAFFAAIPADPEGRDRIFIYLNDQKKVRMLPAFYDLRRNPGILDSMREMFGAGNVEQVEKPVEFGKKRY